ncbi:MAG: diguanylate cyclase [Cyanobacteria bacterium]|nr:diguanylate cyclase [Cyanobacteriota bacterium]MDW8201918.1 diguanylate cyclase [Cyanobacteriota bacterium SKYGB_h_bin112]
MEGSKLLEAFSPPTKGDILVVDDTPDNLHLLSTMLAEQGYKVRGAISGQMALMGAKAQPPDLILLDLNMPQINGYDVCLALKADPKTQGIPVIFISALDEVLDKVRAFKAGGVDYITKPFHLEEVVARVESQLALRRLQRALQEQNDRLRQEIADRLQAESALAQANQELRRYAEELERLTLTDDLTLLANRRCFDQRLHHEWRRLAREQGDIALILCDIDNFKAYNDTYGHIEGDACLKKVAQAIQALARRPADLVARYGGEEFAIVLPNTNLQGALQVAEGIQDAVRKLQIPHCQSSTGQRVTLSIGVFSTVPTPGSSPEILVSITDQLLYAAKNQGKDRIECK